MDDARPLLVWWERPTRSGTLPPERCTASPDDWCATYVRLRRERTYPGFEETTRLATDLRKLLG